MGTWLRLQRIFVEWPISNYVKTFLNHIIIRCFSFLSDGRIELLISQTSCKMLSNDVQIICKLLSKYVKYVIYIACFWSSLPKCFAKRIQIKCNIKVSKVHIHEKSYTWKTVLDQRWNRFKFHWDIVCILCK